MSFRFAENADSHRLPESPLTGDLVTIERLQVHLNLLNQQIEKFSKLAVEAKDFEVQQRFWKVARDLSREAFEISQTIRKLADNSERV